MERKQMKGGKYWGENKPTRPVAKADWEAQGKVSLNQGSEPLKNRGRWTEGNWGCEDTFRGQVK